MLLLTLLTACASNCGESAYYVEGKGHWMMAERCGADIGSSGATWDDVGYITLHLAPGDPKDAVYDRFVARLAPSAKVVFHSDALIDGATIRDLDGLAEHDPSADGQQPQPSELEMGWLEVLSEPTPTDDGLRVELLWDLTFGPSGGEQGQGFQRHRGQDSVLLRPAPQSWASASNGDIAPPE